MPEQAVHYTLVFHITALFQIVNLLNCRRIGPHEFNVFHGIFKNRPFLYMIVGLVAAEFAIIYLGDRYFKTAPLTLGQNVFCCLIALGSILTFWMSKVLFSLSYFARQ